MNDREREEEENAGGFRVKDRRRFDDSGNLKIEPQAVASQGEKAEGQKIVKQPKEDPQFVIGESKTASSTTREIDFSAFVLSLATQALMQLGEMPAPQGMELEKSVEGAKHMIDVIAMLSDKTKGNLNPDEAKLIEEMLHNLRIAYVKHV